jgi:hypothetical protein
VATLLVWFLLYYGITISSAAVGIHALGLGFFILFVLSCAKMAVIQGDIRSSDLRMKAVIYRS